jgi:hypothetical protein
VENSAAGIVSHVASIAAGAVDGDNVRSLSTFRTEDRRISGVVI